RLGADLRAHALRADLHDAPAFLRGVDHRDAVGGCVGHRLLTVDVLAGAHGVDDDLTVPVVGHSGDDAVDVLVVEQLPVATRHWQVGSHNLARARSPA